MRRTLRYPTPPEPGAIVGPNTLGEFLRLGDTDDAGNTAVTYATVTDLAAAIDAPEPRSTAERLHAGGWYGVDHG